MRPLGSRAALAAAAAAAWMMTLGACATMNVSSFVQRGVTFTQYRTFTWAPAEQLSTGDPRLDNNEFFEARVRGAVERGLAAKGLELVERGAADLQLHYHASISQRVDAGGADRQYGYTDEDSAPSVFDAGTLTLDAVETATNRLVWRGWADGAFAGMVDRQDLFEKQIDTAVARILERFPVNLR